MPGRPWTGYGRFCPLARALDVVGERWSLVIIQELLKQPRPYGELADRLPGIGTSVLPVRVLCRPEITVLRLRSLSS